MRKEYTQASNYIRAYSPNRKKSLPLHFKRTYANNDLNTLNIVT